MSVEKRGGPMSERWQVAGNAEDERSAAR